jgi:hypothetical protein
MMPAERSYNMSVVLLGNKYLGKIRTWHSTIMLRQTLICLAQYQGLNESENEAKM